MVEEDRNYEGLYSLNEIADKLVEEGIDVSYRKLHKWSSDVKDFPEVKKYLSRFKFYNFEEVREFVVLWNRATRKMKDNVNGKRFGEDGQRQSS